MIIALALYGLNYHVSKILIHVAAFLSAINIFIFIKDNTKHTLLNLIKSSITAKMSIIMLAAAAPTIISTLIYNNPITQRHEQNFAYPLIFFSIILLSLKIKESDYKIIFYAAVAGCINMALAGIYDYSQASSSSYRTAGTQNMPIIYATGMVLCTSWMIAEFFQRLQSNQWPTACLSLLALIMGFIAIVLTSSRGPMLAIAIILIILFIRYLIDLPSKCKAISILALCIGLVFFSTTAILNTQKGEGLANRFQAGITNISKFMNESDRTTTSAGIRLDMWKAAIITTFQNPLLGIGTGTHHEYFSVLSKKDAIKSNMNSNRHLDHVHNDFLQIVMSLGLIFGFITLLFITYPTAIFIRLLRHNRVALIGLTVCCAYILCGLTDSPSIRANSLSIFLLILTLQLALVNSKVSFTSSERSHA
jgi:O-antigen ligase